MRRSDHTHNGRYILRTGPLAPLLGAAFNYIGQRHPAAGVQHPGALGTVEFVRRQGQKVNITLRDMQPGMPHRLHRVRMEQHPVGTANFADLCHRAQGANLIIGGHNGHQTGVLVQGRFQLRRANDPVLMHRQQLYGETLFLQRRQSVQSTAWCSKAEEMILVLPLRRPIAAAERMAWLSASDPPEVK